VEQKVTVIALEGKQALVQARRASACGDCAGKASCSTMGSWSDRFAQLRVQNSVHAGVGDEVLLEVSDSMMLRIAFQLYGLPMIAFVMCGLALRAFAGLADWPSPEVWGAVGGIAGVLSTYAGLLYRNTHDKDKTLDAKMVKITRRADSIPILPV